MSQGKSDKKTKLAQVLKLVEGLAPEDKAELRQILDETWAKRWDELTDKVERQSKGLPQVTEQEIAEDVEAYREEKEGTKRG